MFPLLPGYWMPAVPAEQLGNRPLALDVAGERIVLFRGAAGPAALLDRCPHRGVALSLGQVVDGTLQCPFHGWRFQGDGACAHVPLNPGARTELLGATSFPTVEAGGLVWVFTGKRADAEPVVPEALRRPGVRRTFIVESWATHWTRAMENMLDAPHLPFIHARTIGRRMKRTLRPDSRIDQEITTLPTGFELRFAIDGKPSGRLDWLEPNGMVLYLLDQPRRFLRMHVWCVPESTGRTRMIIASTQDFGLLTPLAALGDGYNRRILTEDRAVVESSSPSEVPPPGDERSVASDVATLRFRAWYHRSIRQSEAGTALGLVSIGRGRAPAADISKRTSPAAR